MARIRTIKPEFFRHEALQDLEADNPGCHVMLVFAGIWGHCDKAGRFRWKPRTLKLDILPFLDFDMGRTLELLRSAGFIRHYKVGSDEYGDVPSFEEHQRIGGKEAQEPEKHPEFPGEQVEKQQGSTGEAPPRAGREGKGIGREGKGEGSAREDARLPDLHPVRIAIDDWNATASDTGLPAVQKITGGRRRLLEARLRDCGGLEGWRIALGKIRDSPFLLGKLNGADHASWRADFDFIINEKHFTKLMEGGYDGFAANRDGDGDRIKAGVLAAFPELAGRSPPDRAA